MDRDRREPDRRLPTYSVVVPNYNHGRYLEGALRAHLAQSAPPTEIVVVDDGSTDDSCAVAERLAKTAPSVRLVRLGRNTGVNAAINRGLGEARGDFVCFSAADDVVGPEFAQRSLALLAQHPGAAFCFSDPAEMDGDGGTVHPLPLRLADQPRLLRPADVEQLLTRNFFAFPGHATIYRRQALLEIGGFVEDLRWYADWFASCVLAFRHGACYVPQVMAYYRLSRHSYYMSGIRQTETQRELLYRVLDLLATDRFRDVAPAFRRAALTPEFRLRVLLWLAASTRHRRYLTPRLSARLIVRGAWWVVKPYAPDWVRPTLRRVARRVAALSGVRR
jgi:glycosyltransferase involved in cell wall biosynthesis